MSDTSLIFTVLGRDRASTMLSRVGAAAKVAFAAAAAAAVAFSVSSVKAYAEAEESQQKLEDAFVRFPKLADTNIERLRELNESLMSKTRFDDDALASGQAVLAQYRLTGQQITQLTPLLADYAAKTGKDIPDAAAILGKALLGKGRSLAAIGINFKDAGSVGKNYGQIVDGLTKKVGGFAETQGKTAAGKAEILKNKWGELQEKAGKGLLPILLKLGDKLGRIVDFVDRNSKTLVPLLAVLGSLIATVYVIVKVTQMWTAVQTALNVVMALNPIGLIIIAVIAFIAVIVFLWMKSERFRNFFLNLWRAIWEALKAIGRWFAGPFKDFFVNAFKAWMTAATNVREWVIAKLRAIADFIVGLRQKITRAARGLWDGLVSAFRSAVNFLIGMWNRLDFSINVSIPKGIPGIGGMGIHIADLFPDIPMLDTGGHIERTGVAVVHRGEEVVPAAQVSSGGGGARPLVMNAGPLGDLFMAWLSKEVARRGGRLAVIGIKD